MLIAEVSAVEFKEALRGKADAEVPEFELLDKEGWLKRELDDEDEDEEAMGGELEEDEEIKLFEE